MGKPLHASWGPLLWLAGIATAQTVPSAPPPTLRLVPLLDGLRDDAPGGEFARLVETPCGKEAFKLGIDLAQPNHPLVVTSFAKDRLFYVFYKTPHEAFGDRPWMLQRIRKIERTWSTADGKPDEKVTWQVEAFKTIAGTLKSADQHFGSFALRDAHRREIVKEYELGFGEVKGTAEGTAWPFAADRLFHMLQKYDDAPGVYDQVTFRNARRWQLTASLDKTSWSLVSPELGIDLPKQPLDSKSAQVPPDPASKAIVLQPGLGPKGLQIGTSTAADVGKVLGDALEDVAITATSRNISYRCAITCNFADGRLNTVITRPAFAGSTDGGIGHGTTRAQVRAKLGAPTRGDEKSATWSYPGLQVRFDSTGVVDRLVLGKR